MSDYIDRLVDSLSDEQVVDMLKGGSTRRYRPIYPESISSHESLGEEFIKKLEEEGDEEGVFKRYLRKGTRQPGTTKERVEAYLKRVLEEAEREGRI